MIIDLDYEDARRVLRLVMHQSAKDFVYSDIWKRIAQKIEQDLAAQTNGGFYQCSACYDKEKTNDGYKPA